MFCAASPSILDQYTSLIFGVLTGGDDQSGKTSHAKRRTLTKQPATHLAKLTHSGLGEQQLSFVEGPVDVLFCCPYLHF